MTDAHNSWTKAAGAAIGDGIATAGKAIAAAIRERPAISSLTSDGPLEADHG